MLAVRWKGVVLIAVAAGCGLLLLRSALEGTRSEGSRSDESSSYEPSYDSSRFVPKRRTLDDPKVARVAGTITYEGRGVSGASIEATVHPTGYHGWTTDSATSSADGTFSLPVTAGNLDSTQRVELRVQAAEMRGRAFVLVAPGDKLANLAIEVGTGVTVRGRVANADRATVQRFDGGRVSVCFGENCSVAKDDGSFELTIFELGRHRFEVVGGGVTHRVKELPLGKVAPSILIDRLTGFIGPIALQLDADAAARMFNEPDWAMSKDGGTASVRVVAGRGGSLPTSIMCMTPHGGEHFQVGDGRAPIVVPVLTFAGRSRIDCDADDSLRIRIYDPTPGRVVDVPVVRPMLDAVDLGVELRAHPQGARVLDAADEAKDAGLQPGDIVTSIDGTSVANTNAPVVRALGFRLAAGQSAELSITRDDQPLAIVLRSPDGPR
jgi:hypothetical protein